MTNTYTIELTGPQLRVLHESLSVILNDPTWAETIGSPDRDQVTLGRAADVVVEGWRRACRAESTPAL